MGASKLRVGGRFAFITTEYWLRAEGAGPLRAVLAGGFAIERIILFRKMRLFPDAPGQHNMIVVGRRTVGEGSDDAPGNERPTVAVYAGSNVDPTNRLGVLDLLGSASRSSGPIHVHRSPVSPNKLGGEPWGDVLLSTSAFRQRRRLRALQQVEAEIDEGVIYSPQRLKAKHEELLSQATVNQLGGPSSGHGIFELEPDEVSVLGPLTATESAALRQVVKYADVYPYAVVPGSNSTRILYLPHDSGGGTDRGVNAPFPSDMPARQGHLTRFRPLLEATVTNWNERRPWWSIHRARSTVIQRPDDGAWAGYCVGTRWGGGDGLTVALTPVGTVPASGLHILSADEEGERELPMRTAQLDPLSRDAGGDPARAHSNA